MKHWRSNLILIFIFLFGAAIIGKLFFLQVLQGDFYRALAAGQQSFFAEISGYRGEIYLRDKNGHLYPVTVNRSGKFSFAFLKEIKDRAETARVLAGTLGLEEEKLLTIFENSKVNFQALKQNLSDQEIEKIKELRLPGIYLSEQKIRDYPYRSLASHIIGFANREGEGQYGIEQFHNQTLKPKTGFLEGQIGPAGYLFSQDQENLHGSDLVLTIDYNIQFQAEKLLEWAQENLEIEGGQIIVMNPYSGKILALAHLPRFDPNLYYEQEMGVFGNGAIQELFEPGSVFKPITMAGALNEGKITPYTTYRDPGRITIGGNWIENYDQRVYEGETSMTEVLEKSINTGAVFAESQLGHQQFLEYLERFKVFEKTGIDLPGEVFSTNEELKKGYEINFATASFGQGIAMTPLQLLRAFAVIANGGKLVKPYLVEKIMEGGLSSQIFQSKTWEDEGVEIKPEISKNNIISSQTSSKLTAMLVSVVENGFASRARIPGYYIAGKTGTAQIPFPSLGIEKRGYSDKTWQTFVGYAPAFNPRFLILVKLDNPRTRTAEYSAVPIFHDLAKYIIDYWGIPPDYQE